MTHSHSRLFVDRQLCWKDHLVFICHARWLDVGFSSTKKVNLRFCNDNAMTNFCKTWYVGSGGAHVLPMWSVVTECANLIPHLHICSDWLITKKSNIQSSVWATLMKCGIWVVMMGTSMIQVVCQNWMRTLNTSFAYLFWLANNKKGKYPEFCMGYSDETWYVGCSAHKYYPPGLSSPNVHIQYCICIYALIG